MDIFFKEIRNGDIESIRKRINKNKNVVNEIFKGKKPLKDVGQSPLQVALKCANFDIINILLDNGADVDFIEDANQILPNTICCPILSCAIMYSMDSLLYVEYNIKSYEISKSYVKIIERLLILGANPNKKRFDANNFLNNITPLGLLAASGNNVLKESRIRGNIKAYELAKENVIKILDLLIKYGADVNNWLDNEKWGDKTNRKAYLENYESSDSKDYNGEIRAIFQEYFKLK